jgi:selenocysteine lyase/cysteine desulfurase
MVPVFAYEILSTEEEIEKLCTEARILARVGLHCAPMDNFGPSLRFSFGLSSTKNDMLACKVFRDILIKNKNIRAV